MIFKEDNYVIYEEILFIFFLLVEHKVEKLNPVQRTFPRNSKLLFFVQEWISGRKVWQSPFLVKFSAWSLNLFVSRSLGEGSLMFSDYVLRIYASQNALVTPSCPVSGPILTIFGVTFWWGWGVSMRTSKLTFSNTKSIYARPLRKNKCSLLLQ